MAATTSAAPMLAGAQAAAVPHYNALPRAEIARYIHNDYPSDMAPADVTNAIELLFNHCIRESATLPEVQIGDEFPCLVAARIYIRTWARLRGFRMAGPQRPHLRLRCNLPLDGQPCPFEVHLEVFGSRQRKVRVIIKSQDWEHEHVSLSDADVRTIKRPDVKVPAFIKPLSAVAKPLVAKAGASEPKSFPTMPMPRSAIKLGVSKTMARNSEPGTSNSGHKKGKAATKSHARKSVGSLPSPPDSGPSRPNSHESADESPSLSHESYIQPRWRMLNTQRPAPPSRQHFLVGVCWDSIELVERLYCTLHPGRQQQTYGIQWTDAGRTSVGCTRTKHCTYRVQVDVEQRVVADEAKLTRMRATNMYRISESCWTHSCGLAPIPASAKAKGKRRASTLSDNSSSGSDDDSRELKRRRKASMSATQPEAIALEDDDNAIVVVVPSPSKASLRSPGRPAVASTSRAGPASSSHDAIQTAAAQPSVAPATVRPSSTVPPSPRASQPSPSKSQHATASPRPEPKAAPASTSASSSKATPSSTSPTKPGTAAAVAAPTQDHAEVSVETAAVADVPAPNAKATSASPQKARQTSLTRSEAPQSPAPLEQRATAEALVVRRADLKKRQWRRFVVQTIATTLNMAPEGERVAHFTSIVIERLGVTSCEKAAQLRAAARDPFVRGTLEERFFSRPDWNMPLLGRSKFKELVFDGLVPPEAL